MAKVGKRTIKFRVNKGNPDGTGEFLVTGFKAGDGEKEIDFSGAFDSDPGTYDAMVAAWNRVPATERNDYDSWPTLQYTVGPDGSISDIVISS